MLGMQEAPLSPQSPEGCRAWAVPILPSYLAGLSLPTATGGHAGRVLRFSWKGGAATHLFQSCSATCSNVAVNG